MTPNFKAFAEKKIPLHVPFVFVIESGENFRVFPVNGAVAMAGMFGDARNVFVCFIGCNIVFVLAHTGFEVYASLAYVFCFRITAASLLIDSLFLERFWLGFVGATKQIS